MLKTQTASAPVRAGRAVGCVLFRGLFIVALGCLSIALLGTPAVAQDDRYTLRMTGTTTALTSEVTVLLDAVPGTLGNPLNLLSWSFGVCHDPAELTVTSVVAGSATLTAQNGFPVDFHDVNLAPMPGDGFTVGSVVDAFSFFSLAPAPGLSLDVATYQHASSATTTLAFCNSLGTPPVFTVVTPTNFQDTVPVTETLDLSPFVAVDCHVPSLGSYALRFEDATVFTATPEALIWDGLPTTVETIAVTGVPVIGDFDVFFDIVHPFVDDLNMTLTHPLGTTITLHANAGAGFADIRTIYDDDGRANGGPYDLVNQGVPERQQPTGPGTLADFAGLSGDGTWTVSITDSPTNGLAGRLDEWQLRFIHPVPIPDNDVAGLDAVLSVDPGNVDEIMDVDVHIVAAHGAVEQLSFDVASPAGTRVRLAVPGTFAGVDLDVRFDDPAPTFCDGFGFVPSGPGTLADFDGEAVAGDWTLTAADSLATVAGDLLRWELFVNPIPCDAPTATFCASDCSTGNIDLSWGLPALVSFSEITIRRDGVDVGTVAGNATTFVDMAVPAGAHVYEIITNCAPGRASALCEIEHDIVRILADPVGVNVCQSGSFSLVVDAAGPDLTYQWRKDGIAISGATNANLSMQLATQADAGSYDVIVSGSCGLSVTSNPATVIVPDAPAIVVQPVDQNVCFGDPAMFMVVATGTGLGYQWRLDGVDLAGETADTLAIASVAAGDEGSYDVVVTDACNLVVISDMATLDVSVPEITQQPVAPLGGTCVGDAVTLEVVAVGAPPLTYQWQLNGQPIPGATAAVLTIAQFMETDAGDYDVVVTNACGFEVSDVVTLPNCEFQRGDCNVDGMFNIGDSVCGLSFLFSGGTADCLDAVDANDDGVVNIADPVYMLTALFGGGPQPPAPFTMCGLDPTPDATDCVSYTACP